MRTVDCTCDLVRHHFAIASAVVTHTVVSDAIKRASDASAGRCSGRDISCDGNCFCAGGGLNFGRCLFQNLPAPGNDDQLYSFVSERDRTTPA